ncbi:hypothetical protein [Botrimarina mediterranea]|uniref:DUF304 domain-containing protein n=1 Tax=Botrimarina mediterranea TaxID=2528022 RepID=A0A518K4F7_9BACT|nr:hypothetical protein [Botrimarina mediterranea]QDV72672.1 hypothetical protein Spa11_08530 [Botrimarina mediterranea]QDV77244.1 hypothetical protein K2D_08340 [Planctomycetes bacterium K2D]
MSDPDVNSPKILGKTMSDLPDALRSIVKSQLDREEQVLWLDQPNEKAYAWRMAGCAAFGVIWCIVSIAALVASFYSEQDFREGLSVFVTFFGVSFAGMLAPLWGYRMARRTVYVVTSRRAACFVARPLFRTKWSLPLGEIYDVQRWTWHDRSGTLHLLENSATLNDEAYYVFYCVPDVRGVMDLIKRHINQQLP